MRKSRNKISAGTIKRGERKRATDDEGGLGRCQNRRVPFLRAQFGECPETAQAASGMEVCFSTEPGSQWASWLASCFDAGTGMGSHRRRSGPDHPGIFALNFSSPGTRDHLSLRPFCLGCASLPRAAMIFRKDRSAYAAYYQWVEDSSISEQGCTVPPSGPAPRDITSQPVLGGLHHHCAESIFGTHKRRNPARCQATSASGRMIVMALRIAGRDRDRWAAGDINCCLSTAFSSNLSQSPVGHRFTLAGLLGLVLLIGSLAATWAREER